MIPLPVSPTPAPLTPMPRPQEASPLAVPAPGGRHSPEAPPVASRLIGFPESLRSPDWPADA